MTWLAYAALAFLSWGLWAFFVKLSTLTLSTRAVFFYELLGILIATVASLLWTGWIREFHPKGALFGVAAGICVIVGELLFILALHKGKASVVTTVVALYPLLTLVLAVLILHETLTLKQGIAMLFAAAAMILFAT